MDSIRLLTFSTLYPNSIQPNHGIFVETRLKKFLQCRGVESKVLAPIPWFPLKFALKRWEKHSDIPKAEVRSGVEVSHPKYMSIPKFGMSLAPFLLAISAYFYIKKQLKEGYTFNILDAHYYYPDGVAAVILSKIFNKKVIVTARGTDINLIPDYLIPRLLIKWAIKNTDHSITVCEALRKRLIQLGGNPEKISTVRNGVDLSVFHPMENRDHLQKKYNVEGDVIVSVGHLIERKGHHLIIDSIKDKDNITLIVLGEGEDRRSLENKIMDLGLNDRVILAGAVSQDTLREYFCLADLTVLASSREGWANVLLESMACGTPVVATNVWGTPEVVTIPESGLLVERTVKDISDGIDNLLKNLPDRTKTRKYAEQFGWDPVSSNLNELYRKYV